mmetsp:Transcript_81803/g.142616  ORF Transcript_81803/g.142616 Transcript_81803/m.142616 type:complete len:90 (+) Transcript_81803:257-526(+)
MFAMRESELLLAVCGRFGCSQDHADGFEAGRCVPPADHEPQKLRPLGCGGCPAAVLPAVVALGAALEGAALVGAATGLWDPGAACALAE